MTLQEALAIGAGEFPAAHAVNVFPDLAPVQALEELCRYVGPAATEGKVVFTVIEEIASHGGAKALVEWLEQYLPWEEQVERTLRRIQ